ncbi:MAG: T9SS type A sorting domain-containing protein [Bacteroidetes bacterium]|nr:T9SS type A sorting domain-containing protein [Bacteroidota bacterium]
MSIKDNAPSIRNFKIYPNPVNTNFVHIQTQEAGNFEVFDYSGRIVMTGKLQVGDNKIGAIVDGFRNLFCALGNAVQKLIISK